MKILRVNMSSLETSFEDLPDDLAYVGGRALTAKILSEEVPPQTDPLRVDAKLVIACGPIAGTLAPSFGRISVGAKSPLTMGIKEANAGGPAGQKMDRLGIRAIIVEGAPADGSFHLLKITKDGAELTSASEYLGRPNYSVAEDLQQKYGDKVGVICIGLVGERKLKSAAVTFTDKDGDCSRHAARGGLGAVMGAKGLKAIVLDESGTPQVEIADRDKWSQALKAWPEVVKADAGLTGFSKFGTTGGIIALRSMGSMPSKNYSSEQTEEFEKISGQAIEEINLGRNGRMDGCMPGCIVKCSIIYYGPDGKHLTSSYEYETIAMLGTNLGINDPDAVAKFDRISDDLGLDTIEVGSAMGVACSAGKLEMSNIDSIYAAFDEIEKGTEFGNTLANGVVATAKALGVDRIPAFKGQAIPAHDPRATKPTGVTYHTSPMGADHTAGLSYDDPMSNQGQVVKSLKAQILSATMDSVGYCYLACPADAKALVGFWKDMVSARFGLDLSEENIISLGRNALRAELNFNEGSEFHTANEPDPDFVRTEALAPTGSVFDVDADEIEGIWDQLDTVEVV